jgi:hypothetical protein
MSVHALGGDGGPDVLMVPLAGLFCAHDFVELEALQAATSGGGSTSLLASRAPAA